ncbi:MAG: DUF3267 domain-containing protein [Firmicutes bacterium]|nr:DUF3267 domain-containing protein [Bacillota bacterium]
MKLHYKGKYNLNPASLPCGEHMPGAVAFKEAEDTRTLALVANGVAIGIIVVLYIGLLLRGGTFGGSLWGALLAIASMFPHEFLHAVCFKEDVYLYTNLKQGMLFVVGPETMSKGRFIFMSLLPNIVFGFIPYALFMIFPQFSALGVMGALALGMGAGDYYNVFNAATQMPKGARTYLYGFHSYWYIPKKIQK